MKASLEHDRKMAALQRLHIDEVSRHKAEVDAARAEKEKIITENKYLKHDLSEESARAKQFERAVRSKIGSGASPSGIADREIVTTPKKALVLPYRDGFNDDEIVTKSPSKGGERTKGTTPKAGAKRKRKVVDDSPGQPLQISELKRDLPLATVAQNLGSEMTITKRQAGSNEDHQDQRFQVNTIAGLSINERLISHRSLKRSSTIGPSTTRSVLLRPW